MTRKWATVVSWKNNLALISYSTEDLCNTCVFFTGNNNKIKNELKVKVVHTIVVKSDQYLIKNQKVELWISKKNLLLSAMLIYLSPLLGLFIFGGMFQLIFNNDYIVIFGNIIGGFVGFLIAHTISLKLIARKNWQPIILNALESLPNSL